ncbi:MAG: hypothetical protein QM493_07825 [Sulfurovum sp.]
MNLYRFVLFWAIFVITILSAQSEFRYSYMPKNIYKNQLFGVTIISTDSKESPKLLFDRSSDTQPISTSPIIVRNGDDRFYTFYFKSDDFDVTIPELFITSSKGNIGTISLPSKRIPIKSLEKRDDFCGVIAVDMKIKNYQVSSFDKSNNIVTLNIEAFEANLEDIYISKVVESDIEKMSRKDAKVTMEFYVVLPVAQKKLQFSYFHSIQRDFVKFDLPIKVSNSSISTQSDLNPKDDKFEKLKRYLLIFLAIFFAMMFLFKRDFLYLVLAVISSITLLTFYIPHDKICVKKGTPLYILPTYTSTITTKLENEIERPMLGTHAEFRKIEYKKGVIGWIKDEDICNH